MHACMNETMLCFTHAHTKSITSIKSNQIKSIYQTDQVVKTYSSANHQHRFGSTRSGTLQSSMFSTSRYHDYFPQTIQMPATISFRRRHNRQRATTSLPIISTTQMRGDQPPNDDDHDNSNQDQDEIEAFVPLTSGVKNQPVTVQPIYFTNERDSTQRRITYSTYRKT